MNAEGPLRTVAELVREVNRLAGDGHLTLVYGYLSGGLEIWTKGGGILSYAGYRESTPLTPAEQTELLENAGLEMLIPTMGLDAPVDRD